MIQSSEKSVAVAGSLVAVGVGPGDPELLTLKAVRLLKEADVVITPIGDRSESSVALSIVSDHLDEARQQVLTRVFPMRQPPEEMAAAWASIAEEIAALVRSGKKVVFVTLGDPMLYSTFLYLRSELLEHYPDVPIATVPGISSILAAANRGEVPLALADEILSVVPATLPDEALRGFLDRDGTVVLLKVYRAFNRLKVLLEAAGLLESSVYIRRLGLEGEKVIHNLAEVGEGDLDYLSLILVRRESCDD